MTRIKATIRRQQVKTGRLGSLAVHRFDQKSKRIINLRSLLLRACVLYFGYSLRDELPLEYPPRFDGRSRRSGRFNKVHDNWGLSYEEVLVWNSWFACSRDGRSRFRCGSGC